MRRTPRQGRVSRRRNEALSNYTLYTKELGGRVTPPATVAMGDRASPMPVVTAPCSINPKKWFLVPEPGLEPGRALRPKGF